MLATAVQINDVAGLAGVTGIYANRQLTFFMPEANSWIGADAAWNSLGITGKGVAVAILDSGIDGTHPDLAFNSKTVQNVKILFNEADVFSSAGRPATKPFYLEGLADTDTSSGHGTHCAGIAAGNGAASGGYYQGVAKDATLLGIGTGDTIAILWALAGFDYLLDHANQFNIKVVNNSWGAEGGSQAWDPNDPINQATKKVHDRGITVVFAAGNSGPNADTMNPYAEAPWVIGVAAGCYPQDLADCPVKGVEHLALLGEFFCSAASRKPCSAAVANPGQNPVAAPIGVNSIPRSRHPVRTLSRRAPLAVPRSTSSTRLTTSSSAALCRVVLTISLTTRARRALRWRHRMSWGRSPSCNRRPAADSHRTR